MPETDDFIEKALRRFKVAAEASNQQRTESLDDVDFSLGQQWPQSIMVQRQRDNRPCLVMNHIKQFIKQVANDQRQQRPTGQVNPVGDGADVDTAEILQGVVRHIEVNSEAEIADDIGFDAMLRGGFGYERVLTAYVDDDADDAENEGSLQSNEKHEKEEEQEEPNEVQPEQEIFVEPIENPFTVYFDPAAKPSKLYTNARYCFIVEDVPLSDYREDYSESKLSKASDEVLSSIGDQQPEWAKTENGVQLVRVAEYFYKENGKVKWAKINAIEKLDSRDWPGKHIPVIPILGESVAIDGKQYLAGMVRDLKDPQRMYNYWCSSATETIALAPKAPFVAAEGQLEGHETEWEQSNTRNLAVLPYKIVAIGGTVVGAPQRQTYEPPIQAMSRMIQQADNDMKASVGIYDASLGEKGPEQSGKAILARQKQGDVTNLNWSDNLARSIRLRTRMLLDLIPKIYPPAKVQRIIKPDATVDHVGLINSQTMKPEDMEWLKTQEEVKKIYDIGVGRYDVTVSVGPSFQTRRQEAVASQLEFLKLLPPELAINFLDLTTGNMDWPQAQEFAKRAKKLLPPNMVDEQDQDPEAQLQAAQGKLQQMSQQHQMLTEALTNATQIIETKQVEAKNKLDIEQQKGVVQIEIRKLELESARAIAEINTKAQDARERMKLTADLDQKERVRAHEYAMQKDSQGHESEMADSAFARQLATPQEETAPTASGS